MNLFDKVYDDLKSYLETKSKYKPKVLTMPKGSSFPRVVVTKSDDRELERTTFGIDRKDYMVFEIDIYAKSMNGDSELTVASEIEEKVKILMGDIYGFKRIFNQPTPNVDTNVYRITMRFETNANSKRYAFY